MAATTAQTEVLSLVHRRSLYLGEGAQETAITTARLAAKHVVRT